MTKPNRTASQSLHLALEPYQLAALQAESKRSYGAGLGAIVRKAINQYLNIGPESDQDATEAKEDGTYRMLDLTGQQNFLDQESK